MSVKIKGNQWCEYCQKHTVAVKSTHGLRNTGAVVFAPFTAGLSFFAAKNDPYVCGNCGRRRRADPALVARLSKANDKANLIAGRIMATFAVIFAGLLVLGALLAVANTIFG
jgi:hypothetical protein